MKKIVLLSIAILLILLTGCDQDKKEEAKKSIPVMVYETHPEGISSYIKLNGGLEAITDLNLYSMSSEKIKAIHVKEGDLVNKGDLLVEQESDIAQEGVRLGLAGVNSARAQLDLVNSDFERMKRLLSKKAISQQQYDQVEMQQSAAEAGLELAEAQLQQIRQQLNYTKIFAPANGEVAIIIYRQGDMVPAGVPVLKLINDQSMIASLQAVEVDISKIYIGQNIVAHFTAFDNEEFLGKVITIDKALDPMTRTLEVEVLFDNSDGKLKSGLFGEFMFITDKREQVIVLSDSAIMSRTKLKIDDNGRQIAEKEHYVFITDAGKAVMKMIVTGIHSRGRIEITSGLEMGEQVIVVGQNIVKDGDEIRLAD